MTSTIFPLSGNMTVETPVRFARSLALHLYRNLAPSAGRDVPLLLGIHGPPGEGKTYQCEQLLAEWSIETVLISGGELEDAAAGEPARMIRERYRSLALRRAPGRPGLVALVFNDLDAAIGSWGESVQYTVNRQQIYGELMHLADFPHQVDGEDVPRVPVIVTGNDFTKLYEPLRRPGRMRTFRWMPTNDEKCSIVGSIFPGLPTADVTRLIKKFPDQPIAFYSQLRGVHAENLLWPALESSGIGQAFKNLAERRSPLIEEGVSFSQLVAAGRAMEERKHLVDHLQET